MPALSSSSSDSSVSAPTENPVAPCHTRRLLREHQVSGSAELCAANSISLAVLYGKGLVHPSDHSRRVKRPILSVVCGRQRLTGRPSHGEDPVFMEVFTFPYNHEPRLRVIVQTSKGRDIGFHDFNLVTSQQGMDTEIGIWGRTGLTGWLNVRFTISNTQTETPMITKADDCLLTKVQADELAKLMEKSPRKDDTKHPEAVKGQKLPVTLNSRGKMVISPPHSFEEKPYKAPQKKSVSNSSSSSNSHSESTKGRTRATVPIGLTKTFSFYVVKAENLTNIATYDTLDPYVSIRLEDHTTKGIKCHNAGINPVIKQEFIMPYMGAKNARIQVWDAQLGKDRLLASGKLNAEEILKGGAKNITMNLKGPQQQENGGKLSVKVTPLEQKVDAPRVIDHYDVEYRNAKKQAKAIVSSTSSSSLKGFTRPKRGSTDSLTSKSSHGQTKSNNVKNNMTTAKFLLVSAEGLVDVAKRDSMDPYAVVRLDGKTLRGKQRKNAGVNPKIQQQFVMPYNAGRFAKVEIWDKNLGKDRRIAVSKIDMEAVVSRPSELHKLTIPLRGPKGIAEGGKLHCKVEITDDIVRKPKLIDLHKWRPTSNSSSSSSSGGRSRAAGNWPNVKTIQARVLNCQGVEEVTSRGTTMSYVVTRLEDRLLKGNRVHREQGDLEIDQIFVMPYKGGKSMKMKVFNYCWGISHFVGSAKVDVESVIHKTATTKIPISNKNGKHAGVLNCQFTTSDTSVEDPYLIDKHKSQETDLKVTRSTNKENVADTLHGNYSSLMFHVKSAKDLPNVARKSLLDDGIQDPYVMVFVGKRQLKGKRDHDGGTQPTFDQQYYMPYSGEKIAEFQVWDQQAGRDNLIGAGKLELISFLKPGVHEISLALKGHHDTTSAGRLILAMQSLQEVENKPRLVDLRQKISTAKPTRRLSSKSEERTALKPKKAASASSSSQTSHGKTKVTTSYSETKTIKFHLLNACDLINVAKKKGFDDGQQDPYVIVRIDDKKLKGKRDHDGGINPTFNQEYHMPYAGGKFVKFEVWDQQYGFDRRIGTAKVDTEPFLKAGVHSLAVPLRGPKGETRAGTLNFTLQCLDVAEKKPRLVDLRQKQTAAAKPTRRLSSKSEERTAFKPKKTASASLSSQTSHGKTKVSTNYDHAKSIKLHLLNARDLINVAKKKGFDDGQQDPYVIVRIDDKKLKGKRDHDGGINPTFNQEYYMPYAGGKFVKFEVWDQQFGFDRRIGTAKVDTEPFLKPGSHNLAVPLRGPKGETEAGMLNFCLQCLDVAERKPRLVDLREKQKTTANPDRKRSAKLNDRPVSEPRRTPSASSTSLTSHGKTKVKVPHAIAKALKVHLLNANDLINVAKTRGLDDGQQDPYVIVRVDDKKLKGKKDHDGGTKPVFNQEYYMPYAGGKFVKFEVWDQQIGFDRRIGTAKVDIEPFLKTGVHSLAVPLRGPKGESKAGSLNFRLECLDVAERKPRLVDLRQKQTSTAKPTRQLSSKSEERTAFKPKKAASGSSSSQTSHGKTKVNVRYDQTKSLKLHLLNARDLINVAKKKGFDDGQQDPYVIVRVDNAKLKGKRDHDGGVHPTFNQEYYMPYAGGKFVKFEVWDHQIGFDRRIGTAKVDIEPFLKTGAHNLAVPLRGPKGETRAGLLHFTLQCLDIAERKPRLVDLRQKQTTTAKPTRRVSSTSEERTAFKPKKATSASSSSQTSRGKTKVNVKYDQTKSLKFHLLNARDLINVAKKKGFDDGQQDPYVVVRVDDKKLKGKRDHDGGINPTFNQEYYMPYAGGKFVKFEVWDQQFGFDRRIGMGKQDVEPLLVAGVHKISVPLRSSKANEPGGVLNLTMECLMTEQKHPKLVDLKTTAKVTRKKSTSSKSSLLDNSKVACDASSIPSIQFHVVSGKNLKNVAKKGLMDDGKQDPYVVVQLDEKKLKGNRDHDGGTNPEFNQMFCMPYSGGKYARFEVWDQQVGKDRRIGTAKLDVEPFLRSSSSEVKVQLNGPHKEFAGMLALNVHPSSTPESKPRLVDKRKGKDAGTTPRTATQAARSKHNTVVIHILNGEEFKGSASMDPYVRVAVGAAKLKGTKQKNAGTNPTFNESYFLPYDDKQKNVAVDVYDSNFARDTLIGSGKLNLERLSGTTGSHAVRVDLRDSKNQSSGFLNAVIEFQEKSEKVRVEETRRGIAQQRSVRETPSVIPGYTGKEKSIKLTVVKGSNFKDLASLSKMDPYIILQCGPNSLTSYVIKNGGSNPTFQQLFLFPYKGEKEVKLTIYDDDIGKDKVIGQTLFGLEEFLRRERSPEYTVEVRTADGGKGGAVDLKVEFSTDVEEVPRVMDLLGTARKEKVYTKK